MTALASPHNRWYGMARWNARDPAVYRYDASIPLTVTRILEWRTSQNQRDDRVIWNREAAISGNFVAVCDCEECLKSRAG